mmetsp:Transcript_5814/g.9309  ORF Transcript_5814/g.9309 Transcript_5814/m.9309 type:complete len:130 (+) Transcript_5814:654-1043(+)
MWRLMHTRVQYLSHHTIPSTTPLAATGVVSASGVEQAVRCVRSKRVMQGVWIQASNIPRTQGPEKRNSVFLSVGLVKAGDMKQDMKARDMKQDIKFQETVTVPIKSQRQRSTYVVVCACLCERAGGRQM